MTQARDQATETWDYANLLTHAKNAVRMDAEIGLKAVEHLLASTRLRGFEPERLLSRCESCGSYEVIGGTCRECDWIRARETRRHRAS